MNKQNIDVTYKDWRKGDIKFFNVSNEKISNHGLTFETNFLEKLDSVINEYKSYL